MLGCKEESRHSLRFPDWIVDQRERIECSRFQTFAPRLQSALLEALNPNGDARAIIPRGHFPQLAAPPKRVADVRGRTLCTGVDLEVAVWKTDLKTSPRDERPMPDEENEETLSQAADTTAKPVGGCNEAVRRPPVPAPRFAGRSQQNALLSRRLPGEQ